LSNAVHAPAQLTVFMKFWQIVLSNHFIHSIPPHTIVNDGGSTSVEVQGASRRKLDMESSDGAAFFKSSLANRALGSSIATTVELKMSNWLLGKFFKIRSIF
jgi:hypothetical protein